MNWHTQFTEERDRLLGVLGAMTAGGIVENIQHVGATSVSGLGDNGRLDIALGVWPFPLEPAAQQALQTLGYEAIPGSEDALEQRFQQTTRNVQLQISMVGSDEWFDVLVVRDYLINLKRILSTLTLATRISKESSPNSLSLMRNFKLLM
jgi:GrpB-like predicted nucleotidyltransferase (UPF0157 family)